MEPYIMIICILGLLFLLLLAGASLKPVKWIGSIFIKIVIGALLLFLLILLGRVSVCTCPLILLHHLLLVYWGSPD